MTVMHTSYFRVVLSRVNPHSQVSIEASNNCKQTRNTTGGQPSMQYVTATAHATASARAAAGIANFIIDRKLIRDSIERRVWCSYNSAAALGEAWLGSRAVHKLVLLAFPVSSGGDKSIPKTVVCWSTI